MLNQLLIKELSEQVGLNTSDIQNIKDAEVYSTSEVKTNKVWIDGKPIYRKAFYVNRFPNNNSITIEHGLNNFNIVSLDGIATNGSDLWLNASSGSQSGRMTITSNATTLFVYASSDRSNLYGYIIIEYIKTTD